MKRLIRCLPVLVALLAGCAGGTETVSRTGLLRPDDLGGSWVKGSTDEPLGFDTGCIAVAWGSKAPKAYEYVHLVNPSAATTGGAPLVVDEYLVPISDDGALQTLKDFRNAIPECARSLTGAQDVPERLVALPDLSDVVVTSQLPSVGLVGDVGPPIGAQWTVLAAVRGRGLLWLSITGGDAKHITAVAQAGLAAAARGVPAPSGAE